MLNCSRFFPLSRQCYTEITVCLAEKGIHLGLGIPCRQPGGIVEKLWGTVRVSCLPGCCVSEEVLQLKVAVSCPYCSVPSSAPCPWEGG